ncbi:MAG: thiamine phosphate synthase [Opitutales bacterium]
MKFPNIQCLTLDDVGRSHVEQVHELCRAGAEWIQLRMKQASDADVADAVRECLPLCRASGARLILNDRVQIALDAGADGVHLGKDDMPWQEARSLAGDRLLIGGTVNSEDDADAARDSACLDYAGVGPFRFTGTKKKLAPVLTASQWRNILRKLAPLPCYAIGGIRPEDLRQLRGFGVHGVAVSSILMAGASVEENYKALVEEWSKLSSVMMQGGKK